MSDEGDASIFDQWSDYVVKLLEVESELAGRLLKHGGELGDAREALIGGVLSRIVPSAYDTGSGEIVDSYGGRSRQIDIVISRRDAPSLLLPSGSRLYLVESVVATIEVKSLLYEEGLTEALENCASAADLNFNVTSESYDNMTAKAGVAKVEGGFAFDDGLRAERFVIIGTPVTYVFGFGGYKDIDNFSTAVGQWAGGRIEKDSFGMRHVPAATRLGCARSWLSRSSERRKADYAAGHLQRDPEMLMPTTRAGHAEMVQWVMIEFSRTIRHFQTCSRR